MKKISSIVVGATMLGATLLGATTVDPNVGNTQFFDSNREPFVQIVIGEKSLASDGVVAANIATTIGNLAYASSQIEILNTDLLSCTQSTDVASVTEGSVTAEIMRSNNANEYKLTSYINDRVDFQSDYTRDNSYFFNGWYDSSDLSKAKKITSDQTNLLNLLNDGAISNNQNIDVTQHQNVYFGAKTVFDDVSNEVEAQQVHAVYETSFSDSLPACWGTNKVYGDCDTNDKLDRSHTTISLLGSKWVITDFSLSGNQFKSLQLGKETAYNPLMEEEDVISASNGYSVVLKGVSGYGYGPNNEPKATFGIVDENGVEIDMSILQPGETYTGHGVNLHLYDATTVSSGKVLAEVGLFSDTFEINDGSKISGSSWSAKLFSSNNGVSEGLQKIVFYEPASTTTLQNGDSFNLIDKFNGYQFKFNGLEEVTTDGLNFAVYESMNLPLGNATYLSNDFIRVNSGKNNAFKFDSGLTHRDNALVLTTDDGAYLKGDVFYQNNAGYYVHEGNSLLPYYYSNTESVTIEFNDVVTGFSINVPEITEDYTVTPNNQWGFNYTSAVTDFEDVYYDSSNEENGFVSWRGSTLTGSSSSNVGINYATEIAHGLYSLESNDNSAIGETVTANVGEYLLNDGGFSVKVTNVLSTGSNTCSGACELTGLMDLMPSESDAMVVRKVDTVQSPLVVLDSAFNGGTVISVGGPMVNVITAGVLPEMSSDSQPMVKVIDGVIVVAGYTGEGTKNAGDALINWLNENKRNKSVVG